MTEFDYVLVGGGLQNGLIALALSQRQPGVSVCLLEMAERLGGNHTWSFHAADVPEGAESVVEPLVVAAWPEYEVRFTHFTRTIPSRYATVTADRFDTVVRQVMARQAWDLRLQSRAEAVSARQVTLSTGEVLNGRCIIDSRGSRVASACGYQKFLGLEVETTTPWPDRLPVVMDATVPQDDGFHFMYTLPLSTTRVLVEDTYFSDSPEINFPSARERIEAHLRQRVGRWSVLREESGVLPMPWQPAPPQLPNAPLTGGYAGGWFHPATGYSFPAALRFALALSNANPSEAQKATAALAQRFAPRWRFARFLNRLLFRFVPPEARWQVFARLYQVLPPPVLARFYALEFTAIDAARIMVGRPPRIDLSRALRFPRSRLWFSPSFR